LFAQPFDAVRLELSGGPVTVADKIVLDRMYAVVIAANMRWPTVIVGVAQNATMNPSMMGWRTNRYRPRVVKLTGV
jgi:hypothetical protein